MTLAEEIREYIAFCDALRLQGIRDGSMTIEEAKKDVLEMEKWQTQLELLETRPTRVVNRR